MNKWIGVGRLAREVEVRTTTTGKSVLSNALACRRGKDAVDFINFEVWNGAADTIGKFCKKGDMLAIIGDIRTKEYEDRNGNKRTDTYILVNDFEFVGTRGANEVRNDEEFSDNFEQEFFEDLPF